MVGMKQGHLKVKTFLPTELSICLANRHPCLVRIFSVYLDPSIGLAYTLV